MTTKLPTTLMEAVRYFDPETADRFIESIRWPDGPRCGKCQSQNLTRLASRRGYQCRDCRAKTSPFTGTVMHGTHLRADQWCLAAWLLVNCRNGCSSCEIARAIGCKQQSAWHLLHRLRHAMEQDKTTMMGENGAVVEADWTFVGGTLSNMNHARRERARRKKFNGKAIVHAMRERRTGTVRATVMPDTTRHPIKQEFDAHLAPGARIYTDEAVSYSYPAGWYRHQSVNHSAGEYTRGTVHVNGCENFFRCLRMGLRGTYVRTTPDHLQSYADETVFRFNHKTAGEWQRFEALMRRIVGRRLTYSTLTDGAVR